MRIVFYFMSFFIILGCHSNQMAIQKATANSDKKITTDGIVFLIFKIIKDKNSDKNKIEYIKNIKTSGSLKNNYTESINSDNILTIEIYRNDILDQNISINHPLYKNIEYLNEDNTFARKEVISEEEEFSIRISNRNSKTIIKISETLKNNKKQQLTTLKL
jgi:hypothetical protein